MEYADVAKTKRPYSKIGTSVPPVLDAEGWPKEDFEKVFFDLRPFGAWAGPTGIDDPDKYQIDLSGVYTLTFNGQAELKATNDGGNTGAFTVGTSQYNASTNTTKVPITFNKGFGLLYLQFVNTQRTPASSLNSGITNIRLIRPGYPENSTQLFRTDFLNALSPFSTLRFMNVTKTNNHGPTNWFETSKYTNWSDRQQPNVYPYHTKGAPWEDVITLANLLGKDIWINIPHAATDDYIDSLATLFKKNLRNDINIYLEYSNEVWNAGFKQSTWNIQAAINEPEDADVREGATENHVFAYRRYAKRTKRIGEIFSNKFGAGSLNTRVRPILAWHVGYSRDEYDKMLTWFW